MTLATGRAKGFTLLEVMLVLLLLSLGATIVVATMPDNHYRAGREAQRLAERLSGLTRMAALEGRLYGLQVQTGGWQLKNWQQGRWQSLALPGGVSEHTLPEGWSLTLNVAGEVSGNAPQVLMLPGGDLTPFRLRYLHNGQPVAEVTSSDDGWPVATDLRHDAR